MINDFINKPWVPIALWVVLYTSDYLSTIAAARLYSAGEHFGYSEGYELTPYYAADVARLRWFSPRFLLMLFTYSGWLLFAYFSASLIGSQTIFGLAWGFLVLLELAIHVRHARNLFFFYYAKRSCGIQGRIDVAHWLSLRESAAELLSFGFIFLFIFLITQSLPVAGGAISCTVVGINHALGSAKNRKAQH